MSHTRNIFLHGMPYLALAMCMAASNAWAGGDRGRGRVDQLRVATYNVYVGADLLGINDASACNALDATAEVYKTILDANFPERAQAIADEIERERPRVLALQEVYRISRQVPSNSFVFDPASGGFVFANFDLNFDDPTDPFMPTSLTFIPDAQDIVFDYLELLLQALAARGLDYVVVDDALARESDFEVPSWDLDPANGCLPAPGAIPTDVRATDRDVMLVERDVLTANATSKQYAVLAPFIIPTGPSTLPVKIVSVRGYGAADVSLDGQSWTTIVNTHLEVDDQTSGPLEGSNLVQFLQASELLADFASVAQPLILLGDFNSSPNPDDVTLTYETLVGAGFTDLWAQFGNRPGDTCCQDERLMNFASELEQRIDLILVRPSMDQGLLPSPAWTLGDRQSDKTLTGKWPSDHAGVAAKPKFKQ